MLLLGLGNPGNEYANTRHNAGFLALDAFANALNESWKTSSQAKAELIETNVNGKKLVLVKPQTFMNRSGISARHVVETYKITAEEMIVLYDDVDLPFGTIRIRKGGSAGGHNGVKSLFEQLGTQDFWRIRIGIGEKPASYALEDYVLSQFTKGEREALEKINEEVVRLLQTILESDTLEEKTIKVS